MGETDRPKIMWVLSQIKCWRKNYGVLKQVKFIDIKIMGSLYGETDREKVRGF